MELGISGMTMPVSQVNIQTDYGMKMLSKVMDTEESMGQSIVNMIDSAAMERSVNPAVGGHFDMSV